VNRYHARTLTALVVLATTAAACGGPTPEPSAYIGAETCATCHQDQATAWTGSDHDLAMQPADATTVLGDFENATFTYYGRTSTFYRDGDAFMVRTEGPDDEPHDYRIAYTFGVEPLQQYLVEFPAGRLQVLSLTWDARPATDGGQRWYHMYPDEDIVAGDRLHWTGLEQTWNYQCAACHSTNLVKGYDVESDTYDTTWSDIDVACETCHGPGAAHVAWARDGAPADGHFGLSIDLADRDDGAWRFAEGRTTARREPARTAAPEIGTCAPCHSRRSLLTASTAPVVEPLDAIRPALAIPPLYHADGQILEEVYVYSSFTQSLMYERGVTCTDCHDPHTTRVRDPGNALCTRCHAADAFDTRAHHGHREGSTGAACVSCHMPEQAYMGVDDRADHSFRVPRPDLGAALEAPDACTMCHDDRTRAWAAETIATWHGPTRPTNWVDTIAGFRTGQVQVESLAAVVADRAVPAMARASILGLLSSHLTPEAAGAVRTAVLDPAPLVRFGGILASDTVPLEERYAVLSPLLDDPVRLIRLEAARALAAVPSRFVGDPAKLGEQVEAYLAAQRLDGERAEAQFNIGLTLSQRGRLSEANTAFRTAIRLDPEFVPAYINLAELYRQRNRDAEGERPLRDAVRNSDGAPAARHALGLWLVRQGRADEALPELRAASLGDPSDARFAYVYGVALHSAGRIDEAIAFLEETSAAHPADPQVLSALVAFNRDAGRIDDAIRHTRRWLQLAPSDPQLRALLDELLRIRGGG